MKRIDRSFAVQCTLSLNTVAFVLLAYVSLMASAASASQLDGVWVLDAKATENSMINGPRPTDPEKVAKWLLSVGGYLPLLTYEIKGDKIIYSAYRGDKKVEYRIVSREDSKMKFVSSASMERRAETLTVSVVDDTNILIQPSSDMPESGYLLWKRGPANPEQASYNDIKAAMDAWAASGGRIIEALKSQAKR